MAYLGTKPANQVIDSTLIADGTITPTDLSTGGPYWNTSGKVGIGTSSPDSYVTNTLQINGTGSSLRLTDSTSGATKDDGFEMFMSGGVAGINQRENAALTFLTNNTERMRIDSNGKIIASAGTNWVGAVSQSSSSAIIERGSNASGEYVRFADGTLICKTSTHTASSTYRDLTLPIAFIFSSYSDMHVTACTIPFLSSSGTYMVTNVYATNSTTIRCTWNTTSDNQTFFLVFGRWY